MMLIGLNAKNAILIVEYAKMNIDNGEPLVQAAVEAAKLRLRPILMTSFAFILGCVPLAISTGPGAGARVSMGNAGVGGMSFATAIGVFMITVLFVVVERIFNKKNINDGDGPKTPPVKPNEPATTGASVDDDVTTIG